MDFNALPVELLEKILSYLPYEDLLNKTLVCHRWNFASERSIVRLGRLRVKLNMSEQLKALAESSRNHQTVSIYEWEDWEQLQQVMTVCVEKFTPRQIEITSALQDQLDRFYQSYRCWFEQVETLRIGLDDRFISNLVDEPSDYCLRLPNMTHLMWYECMYGDGKKTVTIDAPKLKSVFVDDSLDSSAILRIPNCDKLERIRCVFYTKRFGSTFTGIFPNLEVLTLTSHTESDLSFIRCMPKLRRLEIVVCNRESLYRSLDVISKCESLEVLDISVTGASTGSLDLNRICDALVNLKQLGLDGLTLKVSGALLKMEHLSILKLKDVKFCENYCILPLDTPKLSTLAVPTEVLSTMHIDNNTCMTRLYVYLESSSLKDSLELQLQPFIERHKSVRELTLLKLNYGDNIGERYISGGTLLDIEKLELRNMNVGMDLFRHISRWNSLKHLSLINCIIFCENDTETVRLAGLERMHLETVSLHGQSKVTNFPLLTPVLDGRICCQGVSDTHFFNTKPNTHAIRKTTPLGQRFNFF